MHLPRMVLAAACVAATAGVALAQEGQRGPRVRDYDFSIGAANLGSATTNFDGGTVVRSESTTGLGFNFDYHFSDRWSAGAEVAMHRVDFAADIAVAGSILGAPG